MNTTAIKTPALVGDTLLRVALGIMFIAHSVVLKYFVFTLAGTAQYFDSIGLPVSDRDQRGRRVAGKTGTFLISARAIECFSGSCEMRNVPISYGSSRSPSGGGN
jgi:uncharacterized membrane protein YphA (DoxX/SURF4 family)